MKVDLLSASALIQKNVKSLDGEGALKICREFYASLENAPSVDSVYNEFLAAGGQSVVYRCGTTDEATLPSETASKIYNTVDDKNMTEIELIARATADAGVRHPLYYFHPNGYIEEFLAGKVDMWKSQEADSLTVRDPQILNGLARNLGKLHSIELDSIDKERYKRPGEGWSNTRELQAHFDILKFILITDIWNYGVSYEAFLEKLGITAEEFDAEIDWVIEVFNDHYEDNDYPVLCHNDLHPGNIMIDENDSTGESLRIIDYDSTAYGYRAFDFAYHFVFNSVSAATKSYTNLEPADDYESQFYYPSEETIRNFMKTYSQNYDGPLNATVDTLMQEVNAHTPYVILDQTIFLCMLSNYTIPGLLCEYERYGRLHGRTTSIKCPRLDDLPGESSSFIMKTQIFLLIIVFM